MRTCMDDIKRIIQMPQTRALAMRIHQIWAMPPRRLLSASVPYLSFDSTS